MTRARKTRYTRSLLTYSRTSTTTVHMVRVSISKKFESEIDDFYREKETWA